MDFKKVKIVVTVPLTHSDIVRQKAAEAGAGQAGNYTNCSFSSIGQGRFKPNDEASPHIGSQGVLECVDEERIEFSCSIDITQAVVTAIKSAHPYEEVVCDVYPLLDF
jgi:hypothetical protein